MRRAIKQPSEETFYDLPVNLAAGVAITSVDSVTVLPKGLVASVTPLTADSNGNSGAVAQIKVTLGDDGELYLVTVKGTDSVGEKFEEDVEFVVQDLGFIVPDGSAGPYLTPQEYVDRFGLEETIMLTDEGGTGLIAKDRITAALVDVTAQIDGFLATRYETPLTAIPDLVKSIAADLVRHRLHGTNVPDAIENSQKAAVAALNHLSSGKMVLPDAQTTESGVSAPSFSGPDRVFNEDTLKGF